VNRGLLALLAALILAACEHTPTGSWALPERGPRDFANPQRVTFNPGRDTRPAWLPDGTGFFYTLERTGQDRDHCLGLMPFGGGGLREEICDRSVGGGDSTTTLESAAAAPDGRLAYMWTVSERDDLAPVRREIRLATRQRPAFGTTLVSLPYAPTPGRAHIIATRLQWASPVTIVYLGMRVVYYRPPFCPTCPTDTLVAGEQAVVLDVAGGGRTLIPGTELATSIALAGGDTLYYTLPQDARVFRRVLSTGETGVAYDFGAPRITRDVAVAGTRLVAVIGGRTRVITPDAALPPMQIDDGGEVWFVDLALGGATRVAGSPIQLFKGVALAPDGRRGVAEGYRVLVSPPADSTVERAGDLWLFDLP
jgi:hypothetical protein